MYCNVFNNLGTLKGKWICYANCTGTSTHHLSVNVKYFIRKWFIWSIYL